ncbi:MAG TPA: hypothetical protein PKC99_10265 [Anaerolineales bacterium]|nr:hypothetical protein [Anaerolineae bacterium]MBL1172410.1 hypothetical protein [Chloroflexota bacterium]MCL4823631.1 hypothetical protein [Anaerolineales bacterium]MDL1925009.1 hypothetical protein [Anaerolineae bacterium AMX1]NOG75893.1 hypothetical protein [Chloroflexota bacterium]
MSVFNSLKTSVLIVLLVTGLITGIALAGTDLLNPITSRATANRIEVDTAHQKAMNELDERLATAQTDAEVRQIQREQQLLDAQYQHDIQALSQDLAHRDLAYKTWMNALTILTSALALILFAGAMIWLGARAWIYIQTNSRKEQTMAATPPVTKWIPNLPEREAYDPWSNPEYRRQKITAARNREQDERTLAARMSRLPKADQVSKAEYNNLPLAGD